MLSDEKRAEIGSCEECTRVAVNGTVEYGSRHSGCGHCYDTRDAESLGLEKCCVFCRLILIYFSSLYSVAGAGRCHLSGRQTLVEGHTLTRLPRYVSASVVVRCPWSLIEQHRIEGRAPASIIQHCSFLVSSSAPSTASTRSNQFTRPVCVV